MERAFQAVGLVYQRIGNRLGAFRGSCFALRNPCYFVTAAHCVDGCTERDLAVAVPIYSGSDGLSVEQHWTHPTADLAVLKVSDRASSHVHPFTHIEPLLGWGESVSALGFPEDSHPEVGLRPNARYFTGTVQRAYEFTDLRYRYRALELSFGAPGGLSGGPLFSRRDIASVCGVVAANRAVSTYLSSWSETTADGKVHTERVQSLIEYGIAVEIDADWIDSIIPRPAR